jgi:2-amino-4-hydroxy-6-hydroxymethyldihydropteridine diphosphokinase
MLYLALGSNLGDRLGNLRRALRALGPAIMVEVVSSVYETAPAYVRDQPRFYNAACGATTELAPLAVLRHLKAIEQMLGRMSSIRFGPRLIDLDVLFYEDVQMDTPELTLPHPRLRERAFVLAPLAEIAPKLIHPRLGQTIQALLQQLPMAEIAEVRRLAGKPLITREVL